MNKFNYENPYSPNNNLKVKIIDGDWNFTYQWDFISKFYFDIGYTPNVKNEWKKKSIYFI